MEIYETLFEFLICEVIFFFKEKNVQKYKYIICDTLKIFKMWIGILQKKQVKNNDI